MHRTSAYCCSLVLAVTTTVGLTSCSGRAMQPPNFVPSTIGSAKKLGDLLYVATGDNVYALTYPSGKLMLSLGISGYGLCSDAKGDVFVPRGDAGGVAEYDHDGRLIETIQNTDFAFSCAVDPKTGNLAVPYDGSGENYVVVYAPASTKGTYYGDGSVGIWGPSTYDDAGNLFVDGRSSANILAELKKGSTSLVNSTLGKPFDELDSLQKYKTFLAVANPSTDAIYQVRVVQQIVKIRSTSHPKGWHSAYSDFSGVQTWLDTGTFIGQWGSGAELGVWRYPKGGAPAGVLGPFLTGTVNIDGVVVSRAQR